MGSEHELFCLTDMDSSFASDTDLVTFDKYLNLSLFCHPGSGEGADSRQATRQLVREGSLGQG